MPCRPAASYSACEACLHPTVVENKARSSPLTVGWLCFANLWQELFKTATEARFYDTVAHNFRTQIVAQATKKYWHDSTYSFTYFGAT